MGRAAVTEVAEMRAYQELLQQYVAQLTQAFQAKGVTDIPVPPPPPKLPQEDAEATDRKWTKRANTVHEEIAKWKRIVAEDREKERLAKRKLEQSREHLKHHCAKLAVAKERCEVKWNKMTECFERPDLGYDSEAEDGKDDDVMSAGGDSTSFQDMAGSPMGARSMETESSPPKNPIHMQFAHANPFQPLADQPAANKELHHNALMVMLQESGMWNGELQQRLENVASRLRAEQLAQTCQGVAEQQQEEGYVKDPQFMDAQQEY